MVTNWSDKRSFEYHSKQWLKPKASTIDFINRIHGLVKPGSRVLDAGCGAGAATHSLACAYPSAQWIGVDNDPKLIEFAQTHTPTSKNSNIEFAVGDMLNLPRLKVDGVVSLQTLSWLPDFKDPMREIMTKTNPAWIALTSLFYQGEITAQTTIHEHLINRTVNYNTYSLPRFSEFCEQYGYRTTAAELFQFPFDLSPPIDSNYMGTYTVSSVDSTRIQISGPILMNWMTVILEK